MCLNQYISILLKMASEIFWKPGALNYIVTNKGILPFPEMEISLLNSDQSVYEVIRVIDGVALFLEDHFGRLVSSVQIRGFQLDMELSEFRQHIAELVRINRIENGNVKFVISEVGTTKQWSFSFFSHSYPDSSDYLSGVSVDFLFAERETPTAKIIQNTVRERANQMITDQNLYEVLLVDRHERITEGSRSNVFFVKGKRFYTAPDSVVLAGVTRKKVMECLADLKFTIIEEAVSTSEISTFDAAFLTGTSPKVLPVNRIGEIKFQVKNIYIEQLIAKYNLMIEWYLAERREN